ncbi:ANL_collapsed_G0053800.mRNA.1.CDS.1 [Saccharomyces cerevisiae]|nr:ANL_collapsed_G0053800.mRNA.1.CDS.1 [Saccharomyces cerevisiae]
MASPGSTALPHKRQRVRKACVPCRERKRKILVPSASPQVQQVCETSPDTESRPFVLPGIHRNEQPQPINTQNVTSQNIVDPTKSRYTIQHSAVAFPRCLGLELRSTNPPRLHSFAWHCGIRPEENPNSHALLSDLVTKEEYYRISKVYFSVVHPIFDVVNPEQLAKNVEKYWDGDVKP